MSPGAAESHISTRTISGAAEAALSPAQKDVSVQRLRKAVVESFTFLSNAAAPESRKWIAYAIRAFGRLASSRKGGVAADAGREVCTAGQPEKQDDHEKNFDAASRSKAIAPLCERQNETIVALLELYLTRTPPYILSFHCFSTAIGALPVESATRIFDTKFRPLLHAYLRHAYSAGKADQYCSVRGNEDISIEPSNKSTSTSASAVRDRAPVMFGSTCSASLYANSCEPTREAGREEVVSLNAPKAELQLTAADREGVLVTYGSLMQSCLRDGKPALALRYFSEISTPRTSKPDRVGIPPIMCSNYHGRVEAPHDGKNMIDEVVDVESLLSSLRPNAQILTTVVKALDELGDVRRALHLLDVYGDEEKSGVKIDLVLVNAVLAVAARHPGFEGQAVALFEKMRKSFPPSVVTMNTMLRLWAKQQNGAMRALRSLAAERQRLSTMYDQVTLSAVLQCFTASEWRLAVWIALQRDWQFLEHFDKGNTNTSPSAAPPSSTSTLIMASSRAAQEGVNPGSCANHNRKNNDAKPKNDDDHKNCEFISPEFMLDIRTRGNGRLKICAHKKPGRALGLPVVASSDAGKLGASSVHNRERADALPVKLAGTRSEGEKSGGGGLTHHENDDGHNSTSDCYLLMTEKNADVGHRGRLRNSNMAWSFTKLFSVLANAASMILKQQQDLGSSKNGEEHVATAARHYLENMILSANDASKEIRTSRNGVEASNQGQADSLLASLRGKLKEPSVKRHISDFFNNIKSTYLVDKFDSDARLLLLSSHGNMGVTRAKSCLAGLMADQGLGLAHGNMSTTKHIEGKDEQRMNLAREREVLRAMCFHVLSLLFTAKDPRLFDRILFSQLITLLEVQGEVGLACQAYRMMRRRFTLDADQGRILLSHNFAKKGPLPRSPAKGETTTSDIQARKDDRRNYFADYYFALDSYGGKSRDGVRSGGAPRRVAEISHEIAKKESCAGASSSEGRYAKVLDLHGHSAAEARTACIAEMEAQVRNGRPKFFFFAQVGMGKHSDGAERVLAPALVALIQSMGLRAQVGIYGVKSLVVIQGLLDDLIGKNETPDNDYNTDDQR
ncbi:unnamed protein product [Amoebophrya sp. A25]|nr:unnamed protein product [Amoebophrya sp. A25]|eukprot:GSA25T00016568001.1